MVADYKHFIKVSLLQYYKPLNIYKASTSLSAVPLYYSHNFTIPYRQFII